MSREIKRKINSIKRKRHKELTKRVSDIVDRFGYRLLTDEEVEEDKRSSIRMFELMTPTERDDYLEYMQPSIAETLTAAAEIVRYPLYKILIEDKLLPVAVQYRKSQDDFMLMWRLHTLWMWCTDPIVYREWMDAFGNPEFDVMPSHIVTWYKKLKQEWDKLVKGCRETRIQKLHDEVTSLKAEIADPANRGEPDYIRDCEADIKDIQDLLKEIEVLG